MSRAEIPGQSRYRSGLDAAAVLPKLFDRRCAMAGLERQGMGDRNLDEIGEECLVRLLGLVAHQPQHFAPGPALAGHLRVRRRIAAVSPAGRWTARVSLGALRIGSAAWHVRPPRAKGGNWAA